MNTIFKRNQLVKIKRLPNSEYIEYNFEDNDEADQVNIEVGMKGKINIILPNGQYHVEILDKKGNVIAYAPFNEEDLEAV
ncbi:MAG: hypothetical protein AABX11_02185 [Nanoarchaeota archaeon]